MKLLLVILFAVSLYQFGLGQPNSVNGKTMLENSKPIIDTTAIYSWISLGVQVAISNDGRFVLYDISNSPLKKNTLVIQSITGQWKRQVVGATKAIFSENNELCLFIVNDSLLSVQLGSEAQPHFIATISSYIEPKDNHGEWIAFQPKRRTGEWVLYNLISGKERYFKNVINCAFDAKGKALITQVVKRSDGYFYTSLQFLNLITNEFGEFWSTENESLSVSGFSIDPSGKQVVFVIHEIMKDSTVNSIWYFQFGMRKAELKLNSRSSGIRSGLSIAESTPWFSNDSRYIYFHLKESKSSTTSDAKLKLNVWHYADIYLKCSEANMLTPKQYTAVVKTDDDNVVQLEKEYENIEAVSSSGDFVVVHSSHIGNRFWEASKSDTNWLISLKDGFRTVLSVMWHHDNFWFSPSGRYLLYYLGNSERSDYYSYDLNTGEVKNLTWAMPPMFDVKDEYQIGRKTPEIPVGVAAWMKNDKEVLVYDNFDVWQLDLSGKQPPLNITNGYGRKNHIKFCLQHVQLPIENLSSTESLLLTAFDLETKYNGFYRKKLGKVSDPEMLMMGPWAITLTGPNLNLGGPLFDPSSVTMLPLKSRDANSWLFKMQSPTATTNYYQTSDFKKIRQISNLQPHKKYNWLTAELVTWQQPDGIVTKGILYKPENFDSTKRYPMLISYYRQLSHRLYQYPRPYLISDADLNVDVALFVSRGYLVFTPDIYFTDGDQGQNAYMTVVSATRFLCKRKYIDSNRIGIAGHSFAGGLTNSIVTKTGLFAAAFEGAGVSDYISSSFQVSPDGGGWLSVNEYHKRCSIWECPDIWIASSSILHADKVTTPLLIFHCKEDTAVPWDQALFMFTALWRLGKKVWMLEYEGDAGHGLLQKKNQLDLTIRVLQYFGYYLKGEPAPIWMTKGIPTEYKGIQMGYETDKELNKD